jgi:hypothetical protein
MTKLSWEIQLSIGGDATADTCIYPAPGALAGIDLPKTLRVEGTDGRRALVCSRRVKGATTRTVTWVTPALMEKLVPGTEAGDSVRATLRPASKGDIFVYTSGEATWKIVTAFVILILTILAAGATLATAKVTFVVALIIFILGCTAALLIFRSAVREALTFKS